MVQTRSTSAAPAQGQHDEGGPSYVPETQVAGQATRDTGPLEPRPSTEDAALRRRRLEEISREDEELDQLLEEANLLQGVAAKRARLEQLRSAEPRALALPENPEPPNNGYTAPAPLFRPATLPHPTYKGTSHTELRTFLFDLEHQFRIQAAQLRTDADRISYAVRCVSGDPKQAWINYVQQQKALGVNQDSLTWGEFRDFLEDQIWADPTTRAITATARLAQMSQGSRETVQAFLRRYENAEMESPYPQSDAQRIHGVLGKLRPSIGTAISAQSTLPRTWHELTCLARRIESTQQLTTPTRYDGRQCFNCGEHGHISLNCDKPARRTRTAGQDNTTPPPSTASPPTNGTERGEPRCYNCKEPGHIARNCPNASEQRPRFGNFTCYSCGEAGHKAPDCPQAECRKCGKKGHTAIRCQLVNSNHEPLGQRKS